LTDERTTIVEPQPDRRRASYATGDETNDTEDWDAVRTRAAIDAARRRHRRRILAVIAVLLVLILPFVFAIGWFYFQVDPRGAQGETVTVTIGDEWSNGAVGSALAQAGVVDSAVAFKIWATLTGAGPFDAGTYTLRKNMGARDAADVLKAGLPVPVHSDLTLLLPPGLTLNQIADRVGALPGRSRDAFLQVVNSNTIRSKYQPPEVRSLEGFLFPDTYFIGVDEDETSIVRKLVARFDEVGDRIGVAGLAATNGLTPFQAVVAASLIQTETKLPEDAPLISAVVRNRLHDGMPLEIDSTLCYAKGGCPPVPTNADKALDSPYNTYKVLGLPPTPIASVTEANLRAALAPATVPFKYYVVIDQNGKHAFATTLAEHEANVRIARSKGLL
jgi:UPF0755 protein